MTIDAAKFHSEAGPGTQESACWHIVTFLLWCAKQGMLAPRHSAEALENDPVGYFYNRCGGKLDGEDLTDEGAAFAEEIWKRYSDELADLSLAHELPSAYHFCEQENAEELRGFLFEFLDEELEDWAS